MDTLDFNNELNIIYNIALNNGYNILTINKIYNKINRKISISHLHSLNSGTEKIFKRLPFISNQLTNPIASTLRTSGITPALYNNNNLGSKLINNKLDKIDKLDKSGIYKLTCDNCDTIYIGQTGRSFRTRYSEHESALNRLNRSDNINMQSTSAFANHLHSNKHSSSISQLVPLHFERKGLRLDFLRVNRNKIGSLKQN